MLLKDEQLDNCPTDFQVNCKNYKIKCHECKGESLENETLFYLEKKYIGRHPVITKIRQDKSRQQRDKRKENKKAVVVKNNRRGRKNEVQIEKQLNKNDNLSTSFTAGSGSVFKDGDMKIELKGNSYNVEIKRRTNTNLFGPTKKEWEKAKKQFIDLFITNSNEFGPFISMELETFLNIINIIEEK